MKHMPPQNIEAEQSLLCSCLIDDPSEVLDMILPEDFYKTAHNNIFKAISNLVRTKQPIDLTTVHTELMGMGVSEESGGAPYLASLLNAPVAVNMIHYAKMVKAASVGRKILVTAQRIMNSTLENNVTHSNVLEILDSAQAEMLKINFGIDNESFTTFPDLCVKRIDQYEKMSKGNLIGLKTGFPSIDTLTGGFIGSKLVIIAARPRVGKTAIMLNMAKNMASKNHKIGIFSIEMDKEELMDRQISALSGINSIKLSTGHGLISEEWRKINEAAEKIYQYQITIDDTGGLTIQELKQRARKMIKQGIEIIFIDQLSKIKGGLGRSEYEQRSYIVNELATLKKELRIPICLLAQVNRKADEAPGSRPTLSHLKSTGSLEEDADIILIGHRSYLYSRDPKEENQASWEIAKNRQGFTRIIEMAWEPKTTTFSEITNNY